MNYATIKYCDIANGEGVRTSLFVSGCRRHCPNCFNAVAWDFGYGAPFTKEVRNEILESLAPGYINGLSLLGGDVELDDILKMPVREKIGRAKYIGEDNLAEFDGIAAQLRREIAELKDKGER